MLYKVICETMVNIKIKSLGSIRICASLGSIRICASES